jgi:hypothetical protein
MTGTLRGLRGTIARLAVGTAIALAGSVVGVSALAPVYDTRTWGPIDGVTVTFSVPDFYSSCQSTGLTDSVTTTGIPANWRLFGQILVGYIGPTGAFMVTETIPVDQLGDISIPINYPPHANIQLNPNGDFEYHVSPQIEVFNNGIKVTWIGGDLANAPGTLGPGGQDWDVLCREPEPPPPPPPPPPSAGCTPGYWKQEQHFDSYLGTGIAPGTSFKSIFTQYPVPPTDVVWYFALDGGGGPGVQGALLVLRRAAAAAYLNAAKLNYGATPAQVVAAVNTAATSNNRNTILALATLLDNANNRGCPLN